MTCPLHINGQEFELQAAMDAARKSNVSAARETTALRKALDEARTQASSLTEQVCSVSVHAALLCVMQGCTFCAPMLSEAPLLLCSCVS
jgi:hypothetical protein